MTLIIVIIIGAKNSIAKRVHNLDKPNGGWRIKNDINAI